MSPYDKQLPRHFWRTGVAGQNPSHIPGLYRPKFRIEPKARIASAGSCFAQHVGASLRRHGFDYLDVEPAPSFLPAAAKRRLGYGLFSARYGNIYTSRQLRQLVQRARGAFEPQDAVWVTKGRYYDAFRPTIEESGFASAEELAAMRAGHLAAVRKLFQATDVFVFTLGLTEVWLSRADGAAYPMCPGTVAGEFDPERYEFRNLRHGEVLEDMNDAIEGLRSFNPGMKMVLTVSPVPLTATASPDHVLVATMASKAVLRAVAGELAATHDFVDYFPSFELIFGIQAKGAYYEENLRTVRPAAVEMVMSHFFEKHGQGAMPPTAPAPSRETEEDDLVCDEEMLDR